ncbi:uncharacterized protein LOC131427375 [Malaya genurostris]|uniref:uncharacterized protein LOC131427375 n=1 Tax=Malaya genurostris TaxID=325434 RepID=UPI0026F387DA|nr:uncharacterized protein LOC131427375 [Malaya genurostris]
MAKLPSRGIKRKLDGKVSISEEQIASPVIRWINPQDNSIDAIQQYLNNNTQQASFIACLGTPMKRGKYFLIVGNELIFEPRNSVEAIDAFLNHLRFSELTFLLSCICFMTLCLVWYTKLYLTALEHASTVSQLHLKK